MHLSDGSLWRVDIYRSEVDVLVSLEASEVALELLGSDEKGEVEGPDEFEF